MASDLVSFMGNGSQTALVLAPHTDDAELGCGGTIARILAGGAAVHVAAFSACEESLPQDADRALLRNEFMDSMRILGVPEKNTRVLSYPVRNFPAHRQAILEDLVKLRKQLNPSVVFVPASGDLHQDHQTIYAEGLRAFKERTVLGYELSWNQITFSAQAFVTLDRSHVKAKWDALQAYKSQFQLARNYFSWEFVEGLVRVRGAQIKAEYAEAFEVLRIKW